MDSFRWAVEHPAEVAWMAFGLLSLLVTAYKSQEARIKAYAARTPNRTDDKLVRVLDGLSAVFDVLRLFVPHLLGRPALKLPEPTAPTPPEEKTDA